MDKLIIILLLILVILVSGCIFQEEVEEEEINIKWELTDNCWDENFTEYDCVKYGIRYDCYGGDEYLFSTRSEETVEQWKEDMRCSHVIYTQVCDEYGDVNRTRCICEEYEIYGGSSREIVYARYKNCYDAGR